MLSTSVRLLLGATATTMALLGPGSAAFAGIALGYPPPKEEPPPGVTAPIESHADDAAVIDVAPPAPVITPGVGCADGTG